MMPQPTRKQPGDPDQPGALDEELLGAAAPPSSPTPPPCGAGPGPGGGRTEEEWAELLVALQAMKAANAELTRVNAELQQKLRDAAAAPLRPRCHRSTSMGAGPRQEPPLGGPQGAGGARPHSIASSVPHQAREGDAPVDQYFQRTQSSASLLAGAAHHREPRGPRPGRALGAADGKPPGPRSCPPGPRPSIPQLTSPDTREFLKMKIALENVVPEDASERLKFKILAEHLKYEEASLVADLHRNSRSPYSDTMRMLTKMYAQPHKVAMQRVGELADGPDVRSGDFQAFSLFALRVRSLVGMLEQLRGQGHKELECGSHVTRLLSKLPHELNVSFKRFLYPLRVDVPTLVEFAEWLEYELEVQEDTI